jgi:hypothetical protein
MDFSEGGEKIFSLSVSAPAVVKPPKTMAESKIGQNILLMKMVFLSISSPSFVVISSSQKVYLDPE